ncbi:GNAT family N-acetyltransferase [Streptomyces pacificus]|uniref:GNAT family N-acetyltransferase n=1 Tax=Streptomyces pacificus TaxID=2705029 RepID=A0A6A0B6P2_9ACTN|nr:GNAT family N-acetyltransferase [Streptomyces pacificus]GFH39397.1 GNAT family N-acetyltransferase [Streptomyces pacificus]
MTMHGRLTVRSAAEVPVDRLVRLVSSHEKSITGRAMRTREDILPDTAAPGYRMNNWCLTGAGDEVVAWASLTPRDGTLDGTLIALPGRRGESAARALMCLLLDRADELAPQDGRHLALTVSGVLGGDSVAPPVLRTAGFVPDSTAARLDIDLSVPPLPPLPPGEGSIRQAEVCDDALHAVHLRSRASAPRTEDAHAFRARLRELREAGGVALLLEMSGRPAGYALARAAGGEGRVLELAVAPAFRGLGIGLSLLTAVLAELRAGGCVRALVTLDTGDLHDHMALCRVLAVQGACAVTRYRMPTAPSARPRPSHRPPTGRM